MGPCHRAVQGRYGRSQMAWPGLPCSVEADVTRAGRNDEIRMTNVERIPNDEIRKPADFGVCLSFVIRICFVIRHSSFVIRHSFSLSPPASPPASSVSKACLSPPPAYHRVFSQSAEIAEPARSNDGRSPESYR